MECGNDWMLCEKRTWSNKQSQLVGPTIFDQEYAGPALLTATVLPTNQTGLGVFFYPFEFFIF